MRIGRRKGAAHEVMNEIRVPCTGSGPGPRSALRGARGLRSAAQSPCRGDHRVGGPGGVQPPLACVVPASSPQPPSPS